jgi:putative transposase
MDDGIPRYLSDVSNSFSKYFNTKNQRTGPLFQGIFKGVYVESDEQFVHVSRYIHLNPFDASLCNLDTISGYPWSSLSCYTHGESDMLVDTSFLSGYFLKPESYQRFIKDHIEVTKKNREFESLLLDRE